MIPKIKYGDTAIMQSTLKSILHQRTYNFMEIDLFCDIPFMTHVSNLPILKIVNINDHSLLRNIIVHSTIIDLIYSDIRF